MKLKPFQSYLKQQGLDLAILVHPDSNITYFAQVVPSFALLFISPTSARFYLTKLDTFPPIPHIEMNILEKGWEEKLQDPQIRKVGINKETLTLAFQEKVQKIFPKAKFIDISPQLQELRREKTHLELQKIAQACAITDKTFTVIIDSIHQFHTEQDIAFFMEKQFKERGAELAFPSIVAMGKNAATPHHVTSNQKVGKGFLLLDFGAKFQNYCADMTRVIYLGKPTAEEKEKYELLLHAQQDTIQQVKPGVPFSQLTAHSRKQLGKFSSYFIHNLGHGIGIDIHESPAFAEEANLKVQQNVPFTIEPGIYFPGKFGLRIEDTLVYQQKVKLLTKSSKELIVLPL